MNIESKMRKAALEERRRARREEKRRRRAERRTLNAYTAATQGAESTPALHEADEQK